MRSTWTWQLYAYIATKAWCKNIWTFIIPENQFAMSITGRYCCILHVVLAFFISFFLNEIIPVLLHSCRVILITLPRSRKARWNSLFRLRDARLSVLLPWSNHHIPGQTKPRDYFTPPDDVELLYRNEWHVHEWKKENKWTFTKLWS